MRSEPKRTLPTWLRWLVRLLIWGSAAVLAVVLVVLNQIYVAAPRVYEGIHNIDHWTPMAQLSPEARAFSRIYSNSYRDATVLRPIHRDLAGSLVLVWTLDPEVGLEIALNRCSTLQGQREVDLETLLQHTYGSASWKEEHLRRMRDRGELDPITYYRLLPLLEDEITQSYPGRPSYY